MRETYSVSILRVAGRFPDVEVFATVVLAFVFSRLQLTRTATAMSAALFSTCVFLSGGIIGTFHHLHFAGTPAVVMAPGAVFGALEVVPLALS